MPSKNNSAVGVEKIISGGQTGADRAALDFAIESNIPHGGWCPRGRFAEDGPIARRYNLKETPEPSYPQRTEWNVRDSDGTVIFSIASELSGGSKLTRDLAARHGKPCLHVSRKGTVENSAEKLRDFLTKNEIRILNVAGPRTSTEPSIHGFVRKVLSAAWQKT